MAALVVSHSYGKWPIEIDDKHDDSPIKNGDFPKGWGEHTDVEKPWFL